MNVDNLLIGPAYIFYRNTPSGPPADLGMWDPNMTSGYSGLMDAVAQGREADLASLVNMAVPVESGEEFFGPVRTVSGLEVSVSRERSTATSQQSRFALDSAVSSMEVKLKTSINDIAHLNTLLTDQSNLPMDPAAPFSERTNFTSNHNGSPKGTVRQRKFEFIILSAGVIEGGAFAIHVPRGTISGDQSFSVSADEFTSWDVEIEALAHSSTYTHPIQFVLLPADS